MGGARRSMLVQALCPFANCVAYPRVNGRMFSFFLRDCSSQVVPSARRHQSEHSYNTRHRAHVLCRVARGAGPAVAVGPAKGGRRLCAQRPGETAGPNGWQQRACRHL